MNLLEIHAENRQITTSDPALLHQSYVSKLNLVEAFEKLLMKKEVNDLIMYNYTKFLQSCCITTHIRT